MAQYHGSSALRSMETTHQSIVILRCKVVIVGSFSRFYGLVISFMLNRISRLETIQCR